MIFRRQREWPQLQHDEIVKRARLLVIDDGELPYLKLFRRDGYTFDKWSRVKDLPALEAGKYDVVLLDLHGVGLAESADQGFGVLGHLRKVNPAQIIVAYSNAEWSVDYQGFFRSADAVLHKTKDDYVSFKRTVDGLLDQRFSLGFYIARIGKELQGSGAPEATLRKAEKAILGGDLRSLERYLSKRVDDEVTVERVLAVAQVATGIIQIWSN
jgi:CheY-like chemotaxis protein